MSPNDAKLKDVLVETLLIEDVDYQDNNGPEEIETWDSLAMVSIAAGVEAAFGYSMSPEEIVAMRSIGDIKSILRRHGVVFE